MFARRVDMHLKPNSVADFTPKLEKEIIPLLRKQKGFQKEITFITCEYVSGCDREAARFFQAEPVNGWLCEVHFQQALNAAADLEAADRHKFEAEWEAHLENYLRDHNLTYAELTEAQWHLIGNEGVRWLNRRGELFADRQPRTQWPTLSSQDN